MIFSIDTFSMLCLDLLETSNIWAFVSKLSNWAVIWCFELWFNIHAKSLFLCPEVVWELWIWPWQRFWVNYSCLYVIIKTCFLCCCSLFTNSNWFAFQDNRIGDAPMSTSPTDIMDEINLNGTSSNGNSSSDDEVVVGGMEKIGGWKTLLFGWKEKWEDRKCSLYKLTIIQLLHNM